MAATSKQHMSAGEFLDWAQRQPGRWELIDGAPLAMSPERVIHGDTKYRVARALDDAIARSGLSCRFVLDSAAVRIDAANCYQPDALVYCGEPVSPEAIEIENPVIVVEVLSPGNALRDLRDKLAGYFRVESIAHYLIVDPGKRIVIHHMRKKDGAIETRILPEGRVALDPPGLTLLVAALF